MFFQNIFQEDSSSEAQDAPDVNPLKVFFQKFTDECNLGLKFIRTDPVKIAAEDNNDAPFYLEDSFTEIK